MAPSHGAAGHLDTQKPHQAAADALPPRHAPTGLLHGFAGGSLPDMADTMGPGAIPGLAGVGAASSLDVPADAESVLLQHSLTSDMLGVLGSLQGFQDLVQGLPDSSAEQLLQAASSLDRQDVPPVAPIGPAGIQLPLRCAAGLLPDQEFVPINTDSPSLDRMQALFSSPFAMFGPVTSYDGDPADGSTGSGLLADLHADSQPVENAPGRHKPE